MKISSLKTNYGITITRSWRRDREPSSSLTTKFETPENLFGQGIGNISSFLTGRPVNEMKYPTDYAKMLVEKLFYLPGIKRISCTSRRLLVVEIGYPSLQNQRKLEKLIKLLITDPQIDIKQGISDLEQEQLRIHIETVVNPKERWCEITSNQSFFYLTKNGTDFYIDEEKIYNFRSEKNPTIVNQLLSLEYVTGVTLSVRTVKINFEESLVSWNRNHVIETHVLRIIVQNLR